MSYAKLHALTNKEIWMKQAHKIKLTFLLLPCVSEEMMLKMKFIADILDKHVKENRIYSKVFSKSLKC